MNRYSLHQLTLTVLVIATRLPFVGAGFGTDADGWRIINAARHLTDTERYQASRFPGYPVVEGLHALIAEGGVLHNLLTVAFTIAAVLFFFAYLRQTRHPYPFPTTAAFAMLPAVVTASVTPMDYLPALALALAALYASEKKRFVLTGLLLGLAVGARPTSALFSLLIAGSLLMSRRYIPALIVTGLSLLTAGLCFLPVYRAYGFSFPTYQFTTDYPAPLQLLRQTALTGFGAWGSLAVLIATAVTLRRYRHLRFDLPAAAALSFGALYVTAPYEIAYLIPALPFLLVRLFRTPPKFVVYTCTILIAIAPFVAQDGGSGPIITDHTRRRQMLQTVKQRVQQMQYPALLAARRLEPVYRYQAESEGFELIVCKRLPDTLPPDRYVYSLNDKMYVKRAGTRSFIRDTLVTVQSP